MRYQLPIIRLVLVFLASAFLVALTFAQASNRAFLPLVQQPPQSRLVTLVNTDAGFVAAEVLPSTARVFVVYTDRRDGNRLHVTEHIGDRLIEIADPLLAQMVFGDVSAPSPTFVYPGAKEGAGDPLIVGNELRIYATARDANDPTGPFKVKCLVMPIPKAPTN